MVELTKAEYARFMSMVNTNFERFSKEKFCSILLDDKCIVFEIKEFCNYKIIEAGEIDEHNN